MGRIVKETDSLMRVICKYRKQRWSQGHKKYTKLNLAEFNRKEVTESL
jgi:hypothetical protein